jgi:predicted nucleic acid-binding protein
MTLRSLSFFDINILLYSISRDAAEAEKRERVTAPLNSAIIATVRALGCRELYTEDTSHSREVEGVLIVNPFR